MTYFFHSATLFALSFAIYQLSQLGKATMSTQEQVDALTSQVAKVHQEVSAAKDTLVAQVIALQNQLASAGVADKVDLSALRAAVQSLDDINPDVEPTPSEVPADVPAEVVGDPVEDDAPEDAPPF